MSRPSRANRRCNAPSWHTTALACVLGALGASACASGQPSRAPVPKTAPTKASLFADAALVPTAAGEQARLELALSAELGRAVAALPSVTSATAAVRSDEPTGAPWTRTAVAPNRALVSITAKADADAAELVATVESMATTWLGAQVEVSVHVQTEPQKPPTQRRPLPMLIVTLLGLGASIGVAVDRAFDPRRARRARAKRAHRKRARATSGPDASRRD